MADQGPKPDVLGAESLERVSRETACLQQIAQRGASWPRALQHLVDVYRAKVLAFCMRRGMTTHDVEDLLQELWVRLCVRAHTFEVGRNPSSWIWAIARHLWVDEMRKRYANLEDPAGEELENTAELPGVESGSNVALAGQSIGECVQRGLQNYARIDDEGAMAVQLRDLEGWGIAELAQFLERSEGATRTFLSQVRKKLAPFLKPCFEQLSD